MWCDGEIDNKKVSQNWFEKSTKQDESLESMDLNESSAQFVGLVKKIDTMGEEVAAEVADSLRTHGYIPGLLAPSSVPKKARVMKVCINFLH